jgi:hypothetical protein
MTLAKALQAAAGNAGGGEYVEDVFSTYLYTGTGSTQTITNGIDLDGEGGLVWFKRRDAAGNHRLYDTARGMTSAVGGAPYLYSNDPIGNLGTGFAGSVVATSSGFDIAQGAIGDISDSGGTYASWTLRKSPKFFSVVTYTGDGTSSRQIAHDLGSTPGFIVIKRTDTNGDWVTSFYAGATFIGRARLNSSDAFNEAAATNNGYIAAPHNADTFGTEAYGGNVSAVNATSGTYVAYLFASNAGGFGDDAEQNVISCGSYTGNGGTQDINIGFEPQWLLIKNATAVSNWSVIDVMRGMIVDSTIDSVNLEANNSNDEANVGRIGPRANGFGFISEGNGELNGNSNTFIYIAIRRPMKTPEAGTEVFAIDLANNTGSATVPEYVSGFPVDFAIEAPTGGNYITAGARLIQGLRFYINKPAGESEDAYAPYNFAFQNGWFNEANSGNYAYMFKRASKAFDVVCYDGNGSNQTIAHNLNAVPEFIFTRRRDTTVTRYINVYNKTIGATKRFQFNIQAAQTSTAWNNTTPTSSVFSVGNEMETNNSGSQYIAWMFASVAGVIKVGTYTGTGSDLNVDCGFSNGARFVLIKGVTQGGSGNGAFYLWDSTRGISAGNDPYYLLSYNAPAVTNTDYIDPLSSGFTVTSNASTFVNVSGNEYIFLAIA